MLKMIVSGCNGHMGQCVVCGCAELEGVEIVAGFNRTPVKKNCFEVYSDPMMGTTVTVQQPDGITAVYSNLAEEVPVAVGDTVNTGAVLGTVGGTAIAESGMESHLHLELLAEGNHVDPLDYLPEQS